MKENYIKEELNKTEKLKSVKVTKWQDVTPFAGKVVGYQCFEPSYYFTSGENRYQVSENEGLIFGLVDKEHTPWDSIRDDNEGYEVAQLIKKGAVHSTTAFINENIEEYAGGEIDMRLASTEELKIIAKAIQTDQAEFCYDLYENGLKSIIGQIASMSEEI